MIEQIQHKARKMIWFVTWLALVGAFISMLICIFWLISPYKVVDIIQPIRVLNPAHTINVGDKIAVSISYKKYLAYAASSYPVIECKSGNLVQLAPYASNVPVGEGTFIFDEFELSPKFTNGDECQLILTQNYRVNPLRTITVVSSSEFFTVTDTAR